MWRIVLLSLLATNCCGERILIGSISDFGHLGPLLNMARVLQQNHEVRIASSIDAEMAAIDRNLSFTSVGIRIKDSLMGEKGYSFVDIKRSIDSFFLPTSLLFYSSFHSLIRTYDPDLVICDALTFGCTLAAKDHHKKLIRNSPGILMDAINDPIDLIPATLLSDFSQESIFQNLYYAGYNIVFTAYCQINLVAQLTLHRIEKQGVAQGILTMKDMWSADFHFVNSAQVYEIPRPFAPNTIFTGPLLCENNVNHSPQLELYVAKDFVFVSFGTIFSPNENLVTSLFEALEQLHRAQGINVIYQYNKNTIFHFDERPWILTSPWVDFNYILSQPKLKFFISHGGNGVIQSLQKGKPVLAFPLGADQPAFCTRLLRTGAGKVLSVHTNASAIYMAFNEVLGMSANATRLSALFPTNWEKTVPAYITSLLLDKNMAHTPVYLPWQTLILFLTVLAILVKKISRNS